MLGGFLRNRYNDGKRIGWLKMIILIAIGCVLIASQYVISSPRTTLANTIAGDIFLFFLVASVFVLFQQCPLKKSLVSIVGEKYSLYIYVFHMILMSLFEYMVLFVPKSIESVYMYINPIVVFTASIGITWLLLKIGLIKA